MNRAQSGKHILSLDGYAILHAYDLELSASHEFEGNQVVDIWADDCYSQLLQTVDGSIKIYVETCA